MTDAIPQDWIVRLTAIVEEAGAAILEIYNTDFEVQTKGDESPLTQADFGSAPGHCGGFRSAESADTDYF